MNKNLLNKLKICLCVGVALCCVEKSFAQVVRKDSSVLSVSKERNIEEVFLILKSTSAKERLDAIRGLWMVDDTTSSQKLCEHYFKEEDKYLKTQIVEYAGYRKEVKECNDVLIDALSNDNVALRNSAWLSITPEIIGNKNFMDKLRGLLKVEKNKGVKINAIRKLAIIDKSTEAVKIISDMVLNEKDEDIKIISIKALDIIGTKEAKREIEKYSKSSDKKIRDEAKKYIKK